MLIYLAAISSDEDKSKFELIYRQYRNLMYYAANQILHNSSDAEDVVHQAFLKIVEILDTISEIKSHKTRSLIVTITERKATTSIAPRAAPLSCRWTRHTLAA